MSVKRKAIELLGKTIVSLMPKKYLANEESASKYMLSGDNSFDFSSGKNFTCGFSKAILTPTDVKEQKYFIAGYDSNNKAEDVLDDMFARVFLLMITKVTAGLYSVQLMQLE